MPKEMEINVFCEVYRTQNFTKAAENLFLSQQACSRYVRDLEQEIGFPLFQRSTRKVLPTPEGDMLFQMLIDAIHSYREVLRLCRAHAGLDTVPLRIGIMSMTDTTFIAERYRNFMEAHPQVTIIWTYNDPETLKDLLANDAIDLAIMHTYLDDADNSFINNLDYQTLLLCKSKMYLKYSKYHPLAQTAKTPQDFESAVFSAFHHDRANTQSDIFKTRRRLERFGLRNSVIRLYDSMQEADTSVQLGETITIASEHNAFMYNPNIEKMYLGEGAPMVCIWKRHTNNAFVQAFVDALTAKSLKEGIPYGTR